jgi:hypothetical protein
MAAGPYILFRLGGLYDHACPRSESARFTALSTVSVVLMIGQ